MAIPLIPSFNPDGGLYSEQFRSHLQGLFDSSGDNSSESSPVTPGTASGVNPSGTDYDGILDYFKNLLATVGAENEVNRVYNSAEAQLQRDWSASEAEKQRKWQTEMSNTAYQRAMSDARAAGLNPILIASGGASSTPSGGTVAGNSASYQYGGGDTLSTVLNALANVASSVADFLPSVTKLIK